MINTYFGDIRIVVGDSSSIEAIDVGEPSKKTSNTDLFARIIPQQLIEDVKRINEL